MIFNSCETANTREGLMKHTCHLLHFPKQPGKGQTDVVKQLEERAEVLALRGLNKAAFTLQADRRTDGWTTLPRSAQAWTHSSKSSHTGSDEDS